MFRFLDELFDENESEDDSNYSHSVGLLIEDKTCFRKVREDLIQKIFTEEKSTIFAKSGIDVVDAQSISQNQKIIKTKIIPVNLEGVAFDTQKKIKEFTEVEQSLIRLQLVAENVKLVFIDDVFAHLISISEKKHVVEMLKKIQLQNQMQFVVLFSDKIDGVFFDKLWGYQQNLQLFFPLK